uniref:Uncharacterized protein n=1 Tax=Steinernema glaseri TaxID=37863 RepID=A0A1I8A2K5_9BILA
MRRRSEGTKNATLRLKLRRLRTTTPTCENTSRSSESTKRNDDSPQDPRPPTTKDRALLCGGRKTRAGVSSRCSMCLLYGRTMLTTRLKPNIHSTI